MRAVVLREVGTRPEVQDVELAPPGAGEVRVRVLAAGVCHSDAHYVTGDLHCRLPVVPGHEGVGVVERIGDGVTGLAPGQTVQFLWRPRCGRCRYCLRGRPALCPLGAVHADTGGLLGGGTRLSIDGRPVHHLMGVSCFAEQVVVSPRSLAPLPDDVPVEIAAVLGCAVITGVGAVLHRLPGVTGRPAVVIGAGGVGLSAVLGLGLVAAHPVVVLDPVPARRALALDLGATHAFDAADPVVEQQVAEVVRGELEHVIDAVGRPDTLERAVRLLAPGGTVVALGVGRVGATAALPVNALVQHEKQVVGCLYGSADPLVLVPQLLALHRAGRLPLERLIGATVSLDDVGSALTDLAVAGTGAGRTVAIL